MLKSIFRVILFCLLLSCLTYSQPLEISQQTDPNAFETDGSKTVIKEVSIIEMLSGMSKTAGELLEKCAIPASVYDSKDVGFPKSLVNTSPFACGLGNGMVDELKSIPQLVILATDIAFKEEVRDALVQQFKALTPSKVGSALVGFGKQTLVTIAGSTDKDFHSKGKMTFEVATLIFGGAATKADDALKASDDMVTSLGKVTSRIDDMAGSPYKIFLAQTKNLRKLFEQLNPSQIKADDLNKFVDRLNALPQGQARKDLFEALDGTDVKLDELDGYIKAVDADPSKLTKDKWDEFRENNKNKTDNIISLARKEFDSYGPEWKKINPHTGKEMFDGKSGGYVVAHNQHNNTYPHEFSMAEALAKNGEKVKLLNEKAPAGIKTPDAEIIGQGIWDFKNISASAKPSNLQKNIENYILGTRNQADNMALNLADNPDLTMDIVNDGVADAIETATSSETLKSLPDKIAVVYKNGTSKILTLEQIKDGARF